MKRLALILMVSSLLLVGGPAFAELCTVDAVPAATLLLPYFEVDIDDAQGVNTFFSINNASAAPTLAHVILWTDWSHPTIDFDVFLTGYDVVTVSLYELFQGNVPVTADEARDPGDTISPHGLNPAWDDTFTSCSGFLPFSNPAIGATNLERLRGGHTGQPISSAGGNCFGSDYEDGIARGYITIDDANECSLEFPNDAGYFVSGGTGTASNHNELWGDYFVVDPTNNFAQGDVLVHVEAEDGFNGLTSGATSGYTFYGRYVAGGADNREPLGTSWAARYLNIDAFSGGTDFQVWRDAKQPFTAGGYACGAPGSSAGPAWHPLDEREVVAFDDFENAEELCFRTIIDVSPRIEENPFCFPLETQRMPSAALGFDPANGPSYPAGWMFLNLNLPAGDAGSFSTTPENLAQSHVSTIHSALGLFSVGLPAIELTHACDAVDFAITDTGTIPLQ